MKFSDWWAIEGYKHLPEQGEPPQHAYVAEKAWDAALAQPTGSQPACVVCDTPLFRGKFEQDNELTYCPKCNVFRDAEQPPAPAKEKD